MTIKHFLTYVLLQSNVLQNSFDSVPSMTAKTRKAVADSDPPLLNLITSKKPQWVWQGSEAPPTPRLSNATGQNSDGERKSICTLGQKKAQRQTQEKEASQPAGVSVHPNMPVSTKLSGQRAYLQSLDRSSRDWVLSSGKSDTSEEVCRLYRESGSNIWYNPIPEEEDVAGLPKKQDVWMRRDPRQAEPERLGAAETRIDSSAKADACSSDAINLHADDVTAESADFNPAFQKKGGMIDRLRSPGTVRKLSLKMKKLPELRRKISLRSSRVRQEGDRAGGADKPSNKNVSDQNVISRYHLDSSAPPALPMRRSSRGRSASKGGYLSDGDSPELLPRQASDMASFQLYMDAEPPRHCQRMTGLLTVHLLGLEQMKSKRSDESKEIFLVIQIDGVTRARTALLALQGHTLSLNHTFHLELERAWQLRVVVLTPGKAGVTLHCLHLDYFCYVIRLHLTNHHPARSHPESNQIRNRVCCLGGVAIPPLFKGSRSQRLCVKLEPRGLLYIKLFLQEQWDMQFDRTSAVPANVFGVELRRLVEEEGSASLVPLLIQKTVAEIERRGLKVVGLYRLCGSAAVKKELRDWFERNTSDVCLGEDLYPDINVLTGILKDYLRELPSPLITSTLYEVVKEAMTLQPPPATPDLHLSQSTVELLSCLPAPERATLSHLLDHLSLVAYFSSSNRMTHQNLAVCFGPVLLKQTQEDWRGGQGGVKGLHHGEDLANAVDFKLHIEALHYLLQLWPVPTNRIPADDTDVSLTHSGLQQQQHPILEEAVVSRRGRDGVARLDSPPPINRYAGDWSICGQDLLPGQEADYDEVAGSESDEGSDHEVDEAKKEAWFPTGSRSLFVDDVMDFDAPFTCRLSLKDFDSLIHDLDRQLAKQINICL
ncbi:rho GTPase-activating protein SYDE1 isoform X2 [Dunckerocampus dactyliophorus]|uniref:rho GTPase-activating protein SYDE1 isoform X2 n=1 Tax=Dunckerocampus dactyliophorus TaxID=161453 RepID=UPI002405DF56|nr:rho GTPase-activating protein SYDE1 isoform X2 [Dunckerocampus dactyliophorus]